MTTAQLADLLGVRPSQVSQRMAVPRQRGEWIAPARGFWVPVPPEFRGWDGPPVTEFIDAFASYLDVDYYLGWLSAAAHYGVAHHAPQVSDIAVSRMVRDRTAGRASLVFHERSMIDQLPKVRKQSHRSAFWVSTPEVTALDIASDIRLAAGLDNAATIIVDLAHEIGLNESELTRLAPKFSDVATRRIGWIIETSTGIVCDELASYISGVSASPARLHPSMPLTGELHPRWGLRINTTVEVE